MMKPKGFVGVVTVLIVSAIVLTLAVTAAFLAIDELLLTSAVSQSQAALHLADGCADEAAFRLKRNPSYAGGTVPFAGGSCTVSISGSGNTRTVTSTVVLGDFTRTVQTSVTLTTNVAGNTNGIDVTQWQEL